MVPNNGDSSALVLTSLLDGDCLTTNSWCQLTLNQLLRVRITLRLAVYRQSVRLGVKPLEIHDQRIIFFNWTPHGPHRKDRSQQSLIFLLAYPLPRMCLSSRYQATAVLVSLRVTVYFFGYIAVLYRIPRSYKHYFKAEFLDIQINEEARETMCLTSVLKSYNQSKISIGSWRHILKNRRSENIFFFKLEVSLMLNSMLILTISDSLTQVTQYCKHNRSLMVAVQGPDFWPSPYTYIHSIVIQANTNTHSTSG
jgi:hypothetical protein